MLNEDKKVRNEVERPGADAPRVKQRRGFAAMDPAKQREIASRGGRASHERGTGHEWSPAEAREAGRKGGKTSQQRRAAARPTPNEEEPR